MNAGAASLRWIQGLGTALLPPRSCQSTLCKGSNEVQTLYPGILLEGLSVKGLAGVVTHLLVKLGAQNGGINKFIKNQYIDTGESNSKQPVLGQPLSQRVAWDKARKVLVPEGQK